MSRTDRPARRVERSFPWALAVVVGALLLLGFGFAVVQRSAPRGPQSAGSAGLAVGAPVPTIALPATMGGMLSLDQLRGSKVVVYFYEGAG